MTGMDARTEQRAQGGIALFTALCFALAHVGIPFATFTDSVDYVFLREAWGVDPRAWQHFAYVRPALPQLFFLAFPSPLAVSVAQGALSFGAWLWLAFRMAGLLTTATPRFRLGVFAVTLWGALGGNVLFWNRMLLTESLTLSALCLFLGSWLRVWQTGRGWVALLLSGVAPLFLRDTMLYFVVPLVSVIGIAHGRRPAFWGLLSTLIVATFSAGYLADAGGRHLSPLTNSLYHRVLPDPAATAFFAARGMPQTKDVMICAGRYAYTCPAPEALQRWVIADGKAVYQAWLLYTLPARTIDLARWFLTDAVPGRLYRGYPEPPIASRFYSALSLLPMGFPLTGPLLAGLAVVAFLRAGYGRWRQGWRFGGAEGIWLAWIVVAGANLFVSYWGDAMEVKRHALIPCLTLTLAFSGLLFRLWSLPFSGNPKGSRGFCAALRAHPGAFLPEKLESP